MFAECYDEFWLNDAHLPVEVGVAGFDFCGRWVAVARRSAFDYVCDEDVIS